MNVLRSLKHRPFALLWTGQIVSRLGDSLHRIALAWWVLLPVGFAIAGWATYLVGAPTVFLVGDACTIALTLIGLSHPTIRTLD